MSADQQADEGPDKVLAHALQATVATYTWYLLPLPVLLAIGDYSDAANTGPDMWTVGLAVSAAMLLHEAWFIHFYGQHVDEFTVRAPRSSHSVSGRNDLRVLAKANVVIGLGLLVVLAIT